MRLSSLVAGNFKALRDTHRIDIRPLTLFIGSNSSGKSSCLHALAAMSQTSKLHNNRKPLVLDDEYALVHLGRFIDAIHTKTYDDAMTLGVTWADIRVPFPPEQSPQPSPLHCELQFRTARPTQETYVDEALVTYRDSSYRVKQAADGYLLTKDGSAVEVNMPDFGYGVDIGIRSTERPTRDTFEFMMEFSFLMSIINSQLSDMLYLGPFREPPGRAYNTFGATPKEVGARGEATASLLANEVSQKRSRDHLDQISEWLRVMGLGRSIEVSRLGGSDLFEVGVNTDREYAVADLGYGISQVLPVLAQCSFAANGSTLLFEQPELHLHPLAASRLVNVFTDVIKKKACTVIAEIHSKDIIHNVQRFLGDGKLLLEDICVYLVRRASGISEIRPLDINNDGEIFDNWNVGFDS
jgi:predicted ATPase